MSKAAAQRCPELVEDLQVGHRRRRRFGDGQHHRIVVAGHRVHDGAVHAGFFAGEVTLLPAARVTPGLAPKTISVRPTRIWSPRFSVLRVGDAGAVDIGAVGAAQIAAATHLPSSGAVRNAGG